MGERRRIILNSVQCKKCGDIIESKSRHDFVSCSCGNIAVDGGHDYLRRVGKLDGYVELSKAVEVDNDEEDGGAFPGMDA